MYKLRLKYFPFTVFLLMVIFYLSFFNPPSTGLSRIPHLDKLIHVCMYAGLSGVCWLEYLFHYRGRFSLKQIIGLGVVVPILISSAIELGQEYLTENRSGDWWDLLANITGVVLASLIGYFGVRPQMQ